MEIVTDTTVLIDTWRYWKSPKRLKDLEDKTRNTSILVPWITQAQFSRGALFKGIQLEEIKEFYKSYVVSELKQNDIDTYCHLWVEQARKGKRVDYPDLWIAASAISRGNPLVTRNAQHFKNIDNLELISYTILPKKE